VGENVPYQYLDREYMKAEEYDEYLLDPTGFFLSTYLPRIAGAFEGLQELPGIPALHYTRLMIASRSFASPREEGVRRHAGRRRGAQRLMDHAIAFAKEMAASASRFRTARCPSRPMTSRRLPARIEGASCSTCTRRRDKLVEALDRAAIFIARQAIAVAKASPSPFVFIPCHWGLDGFMSPEHFRTVYWPSFRKVLLALIEANLIRCLSGRQLQHAPGDHRRHSERKAVYWFERTDLVGPRKCWAMSSACAATCRRPCSPPATPEQVDDYCRVLIEKVGKGGGFILDGAIGIRMSRGRRTCGRCTSRCGGNNA